MFGNATEQAFCVRELAKIGHWRVEELLLLIEPSAPFTNDAKPSHCQQIVIILAIMMSNPSDFDEAAMNKAVAYRGSYNYRGSLNHNNHRGSYNYRASYNHRGSYFGT